MNDSTVALATTNQKRHAVARCRWCGGQFVRVYVSQWLCESEACAEKQLTKAVKRPCELPDVSPYLFIPLPYQIDIEDHPVKRLLVHGAAGVSKSYFGRWYAYKRCLQIPGFRALLLRNTYDQLTKNHLQYMESEADALGPTVKWHQSGPNAKQMWFAHAHKPTARFFMGFLDDEADIDQHVGPEWDLVLLEEGVKLIPKGIREVMARDRGNAESRPYREELGLKGQTRILTNPGGRAMVYLDDLFIKKQPDKEAFKNYNPDHFAHTKGDVADNPYLDEDFVETSLGHLDDVRHGQLAEGLWDRFEGQMFPMFDRLRHVQSWPLR